MSFWDMSIRRKLLLAAILTAGFAVFSLAILSFAKETFDWRAERTLDLKKLATVVADVVTPDMAAGNWKSVRHTLAAFVATPDVTSGAVYDAQGKLVSALGEPAGAPASEQAWHERGSEAGGLIVEKPVLSANRRLGTIYFKSDFEDLYSDMLGDGVVMLAVSLVAFVLVIFVFLRIGRRLTDPVEQLSLTMQEISHSKNYKSRVKLSGHDEIGMLASTFNAMLGAVEERDARLAAHQSELETTINQRTTELNTANVKLQSELIERKAALQTLHAHDAMLKAVAKAAEALLGSLKIDDAIASVMELVGQTLAVSRIQFAPATMGRDGHLRVRPKYEWCSPGSVSMLNEPLFQDIDITALFPHAVASSLLGEPIVEPVADMPKTFRDRMEADHITSMLIVPVLSDGKFWGNLVFMDTTPGARPWSWAETDTLKTLGGLLGVSISRARIVKELADANAIVQNSPTVLYRLKGEPALPLTYISHNITKFGYDPAKLIGSEKFLQTVVHPDDHTKVRAAMASIMEKDVSGATIEFRLMLPSGSWRWVENRYTPVRDSAGRLIEIEGIVIDITERKAAQDKIDQLARTDALTGLANRATFVERLHQAFSATKRGAAPFAVLYLDLDHFKDINDTRGHPTGDMLLREAADRLRKVVRENDVVARLGGDEFAVLQSDVTDPTDSGALAAKICSALSAPYLLDSSELRVTVSIGISPFSAEAPDSDSMLARADLALYRAKEDGRDQYRFHSDDLDRQVSERVALADELRKALGNNEIEVYYQPEVELLSGTIVGMEALVRWHHPTRGTLAPAAFIGIAEHAGLIQALGQLVLDRACQQMKLWRAQGIAPPVIAVNVSLFQLKAGSEFIKDITNALAKAELPADALELDVTESMLAQATLSQNDVLDRLQQLGVRIALDHFGTEYSSFDYLRTYRVSHLKVAHEFIQKATEDPAQAATVRAIIGVARELGIHVIAEGVETNEQRALLVSIGAATRGQGFLFSGAVPAAQATELLKQRVIKGAAQDNAA
ncbi:MAG TPA: EAL domain-containing protein [Rhizomicrobium sp.]|nr:EAL domain-containing protein [Rhizomicrobium sp.]